MIRIAICYDDKSVLECVCQKIKSIAEKLKEEIQIETFAEGNKMLSRVNSQMAPFNLLFLDIDMPKVSGFEIAEFIRKFNESTLIIFLSSVEELVYESFKYKPFGFIRKHKLGDELCKVLISAIDTLVKSMKYEYSFKTEDGNVKIGIDDILYIECLNRKVYLKINTEKFRLIGAQFYKVVSEFLDKGFILIHRSCIVNLKYIHSINKFYTILSSGEKLPISRYKVNDVKSAFHLYSESTKKLT